MLQPFDKLRGCKLAASDGEIGEVSEFYFDDDHWTVRYLVVETGSWLSGRRVLIAPNALREVDAQGGAIAVNLTQEQVRNSPPLESDKPVVRQHEEELHRYYKRNPYWAPGGTVHGLGIPPTTILRPGAYAGFSESLKSDLPPETSEPKGDPHLRSSAELLSGYTFHTDDGEIGIAEDFIVDDEDWTVRYFVVRTGVWFFGKEVLLALDWIEKISLERAAVVVDLPRSAIKEAPEYDSDTPISRAFEQRLHDHYGRKRYWDTVETTPE